MENLTLKKEKKRKKKPLTKIKKKNRKNFYKVPMVIYTKIS